jgi:hypothetical protein
VTRRDFILIASVIRDTELSTVGKRRLALAMAAQLAAKHPSFDKDRFIAYALDKGN